MNFFNRYNFLFIVLLSTIFTSGLYAKENELQNVSIQLKWFFQYQFAGVLVAKEKGFYEDAGLNVNVKERDPKKNNILQVLNGESEYGIADSVILRYRAQGADVKVLATIFQHNAMVLMSKKTSGIVSPYEMKGKKISYQEGLDDSIISSLFAFANINEDEHVHKAMDFTKMDFVNGEVDVTEAYISIEPYWLKEKYDIDVNIIDPKNYGIDFYGDLIFTTQKEIDKHPKRVEAFKNATLKGWAYALNHQDEAIKIILDKYNTRDLTYEQLLYEARVTQNLIATKYVPLGNVKEERFQVLATLYTSKGLSKRALDNAVKSIIYNPNVKQHWFVVYFYEIITAVVLWSLLVLFLFFNNRRLKYLVNLQTEELQKSTEEQKILLSLFDIGESVLFKWNNDETWSIDYVSKSVQNLLGYEKKEFMNKEITYAQCVHKDDLDKVAEEVKIACESVKDYFKHEPYRIITKSNETKWVIDHTVIERDRDDNIIHFIGYISDITEIKKQHQLLNYILNATDNIMLLTDFKDIKFSNNKLKELLNIEDISLFNKSSNHGFLNILLTIDGYLHQGLLRENEDFLSLVSRTAPENRIISILDANSTPKAFKISISKTTNDGDYLVSLSDITEMKEQHVATTKKAYVDGLTQVYNRNKFDEIFKEELKSAQRYGNPLSIALLDIDKFKNFNDNYGHLIGDEVLITMAQIVNKNVRETDTFARWGGEEFVILFKNTSIQIAKEVSEKLKTMIQEQEHPIAGKITASFGCTEYRDGDSMQSVFKRCDDALYLAKENGRNRVEVL